MITHQSPLAPLAPFAVSSEWGVPKTVSIRGWNLATSYPAESNAAAHLVDLSHCPKAVLWGPHDMSLAPGQVQWTGTAFISCRKPGEHIIWHITGEPPDGSNPYYTDLTDAWALMAIIGPRTVDILNRLIPIDFEQPHRREAWFGVVRCHGLWVQVLNPKKETPGILLACERSHTHNLVQELLQNGVPLGLQPGGLNGVDTWLG